MIGVVTDVFFFRSSYIAFSTSVAEFIDESLVVIICNK